MKAVFIGADPRATELATMAFRLRSPDATSFVAASGSEGLKLIEQESPDIGLIHPDFTDMTLTRLINRVATFQRTAINGDGLSRR
jgi:hypothetical protein